MDPKLEIRTLDSEPLELRAASDGAGMTFAGYAIRYDVPSLPLPFVERVAPDAATRSLKSRNDVRMYVNHDDRMVLGSTRAKTLRLDNRADGLYVEGDLPDTSYGNDLRVLLERGDVYSMSFGFSTVRDSWSADRTERTLEEIRVHEVSVVTGVAAYPQTTASVRSMLLPAVRAMVDVDALNEAMAAMADGVMSPEQLDIVKQVVAALETATPEPECIEVEASISIPMSMLRARLDWYERAIA